jgi:hypothetical protein
MTTSLTTFDGFPRSDIDVAQSTHASRLALAAPQPLTEMDS